jgi:hypothetical protein
MRHGVRRHLSRWWSEMLPAPDDQAPDARLRPHLQDRGSTVRYMLPSSYGARHCDVEPWHAASEDPPCSAEDLRRVRTISPRWDRIAGHAAGCGDVACMTDLTTGPTLAK